MTLADNGYQSTSENLECNEQVIETFFPLFGAWQMWSL